MLNNIPKISVLVITYNQENVIARAVESLLSQKDYIYEICVSDDCSNDRTWEILQDYKKKYPSLFVLNRNEPNIGIFENVEKTWTMPSGDIIYQLSGDDECGEGWFERVVDYLRGANVDYLNELFCVYGDYKAIYPNGDAYIKKNDFLPMSTDAVRLSLRGLMCNRSACYSKKILDKFQKISQGKSYVAEEAQDIQLQLFSQHTYYISYVGNVYYARIGISTRFNFSILREREEMYNYARALLERNGYVLNKKDINYIRYKTEQACLKNKKSIIGRFWRFYLYLNSIDIKLGFRSLNLKWYYFSLVRRIPHHRPLEVTI